MSRFIRSSLACITFALVSSSCASIGETPAASGLASTQVAAPGNRSKLVAGLRAAALPLTGKADDYNALLTQIGDARVVMLGEATHGTQEFYRERMRITQRLVRDKGFSAVVIEGDWPDAYRVNRYIRGLSRDTNASQALSGFTRFPQWMWRNTVARDLVESLRAHNAALPDNAPRVGFYGMDLYSLAASTDAVAQHLESVDAQQATRARERYRGFGRFRETPELYGLTAQTSAAQSLERPAQQQFRELQQLHAAQPVKAESTRREELFAALQNARVVKNAEEYYRVSYSGAESSWNLRDRHMADTLDALLNHLSAPGKPAKIVVWAHNSHVGDARQTTMGESGEWTVGQLMRQRHTDATFLLGFTTYSGTAMAAMEWGEQGRVQRVRPALPGSFAALFHDTGMEQFLLPLRGQSELVLAMGEPRLERAIGVVYLPQTERESHYFQARMSKQFDAVIHIDTTTAVTPLPR
ncbi:MAG TPA: erythromycin esterase family protein [Abditibacteriaceae bacterium]|jgi:erythromycin esterase-like protein